ncbi:putative ribonuclease H-like domain-containing protein [Tanacetum coccineum]
MEKVRDVAYKLKLPKELSRVHNTFHVSNLKKCHADEPLAVLLDGLHVDDKLHFVEEPVEIIDREVKRLKRSRIPLVKVRWNSKRGPEFTWEREDQFRKKYPHLFSKTASSSITLPGPYSAATHFWGCYNSVLFTDTICFVLSPDFKLPDESQVLLKVPRKNNMYSVDMKNIVPKERLTCLVAKDNLVRGLPSKHFENDQTCVACLKGKQHKASCKSKIQNSITQPLFMLYMALFGLTFVSSLMHKKYCLVVTDDYSRFTWVFFLATEDETSGILKSFITEIENLVDKKVKIIRCDNETEFKNKVMSEFCEKKGIKREFSVARTPQQNGIAERRNRTLIEAARTMLADSKLPTTFWTKAVNTAYYVQNRVLVVKPHNKTPYELFRDRTPALSFMKPFGCHVTILNTLDYLGKFDGKSDDGFFVGYSLNSKAFRVYNIRTMRVEENLHIRFLEDNSIIACDGPN